MSCQKLDQDEILSIRWAHDDPNPVAKDSIARADRDAMVALLQAKGISLTPAGFEYPADYPLPEAKRLRLDDQSTGKTIDIYQQYPHLAYPNTDSQFQATTTSNTNTDNANSNSSSSSDNFYEQYYAQYYAQYYQNNATTTTTEQPSISTEQAQKDALVRLGLSTNENADTTTTTDVVAAASDNDGDDNEDNEDDDGDDWRAYIDEVSGATYYFNSATGESSWTPPENFKPAENNSNDNDLPTSTDEKTPTEKE